MNNVSMYVRTFISKIYDAAKWNQSNIHIDQYADQLNSYCALVMKTLVKNVWLGLFERPSTAAHIHKMRKLQYCSYQKNCIEKIFGQDSSQSFVYYCHTNTFFVGTKKRHPSNNQSISLFSHFITLLSAMHIFAYFVNKRDKRSDKTNIANSIAYHVYIQ